MAIYLDEWPQWAKTLCGRFGKPHDFDPFTWERIFNDDLGRWNAEEVESTLAWMQSEGQSWKAPATAPKLCMAVRCYRKFQAAERHGYRPTDAAGFLGRVKAAMLRADSWAERWDIMCSPSLVGEARETTADECDELNAWAGQQWPEWEQRAKESRTRMLGESRRILDEALREAEPLFARGGV